MTLTDFLLARIAEDEAVAKVAAGMSPVWDRADDPVQAFVDLAVGEGAQIEIGDHILRHDPARVLAQCAALRRIVESARHAENLRDEAAENVQPDSGYVFGQWSAYSATLRAVASIWAGADGWREEWAL